MYAALAVVSLHVALSACSENKKKPETKVPDVPTVNADGLKIAFYNSDSLALQYTYLVEQDSLIKIKQKKFEAELMSRDRNLQNLAQEMNKRQQNMTASGAELQQMQNQLQRKQQDAQMYQQSEGTKLQNEAAEIQTVIAKKIEEASKLYCEKYKIDILLVHGQGGQFAYIKPTMDVTESFIQFVNDEQDKLNKKIGK
jgi:outer membrane protein